MRLRLFPALLLLCSIGPLAHSQASYHYLEDANQLKPDDPATRYPMVGITEPRSDQASPEALSRYDLLGTKSGMAYKVAAAQGVNPDVRFHYMFHHRAYLGYEYSGTCEIAVGMPFGDTGPATEACDHYAGHWLYRAGTRLQRGVSSTDRTLLVQDASNFTPGRYLVIYSGGPGGFANAEHAQIASVNRNVTPNQIVLSVRGYKSQARSHGAQAIVAEHALGQTGNPRNWAYNLATTAPRDSNGRAVSEIMAAWIPQNMRLNGKGRTSGARVDGIYFDEDSVFFPPSAKVDVNNDLQADDGFIGSRNVFHEGQERFYAMLRDRVGDSLNIVGGWYEARGFEDLNGIQMENFLLSNGDFSVDPRYVGADGAQPQMHNYLMHTQIHKPQRSYVEILSKNPSKLYPGTAKNKGNLSEVPADNSHFRLTFGATLLGNGLYVRQNSSTHPAPWHDEYSVDVEPGSSTYGHAIASNAYDESEIRRHKGWLGRPLGPRQRIYNDRAFAPENNLISDSGFESGMGAWETVNLNTGIATDVRAEGQRSLRVDGHRQFVRNLGGAVLKGPKFNMQNGRDYTIVMAVRADKPRDISLRLDFSGKFGNYLVGTEWTRIVYTVRANGTRQSRPIVQLGRDTDGLWFDDVRVFEGNPNVFRRDYENGVVVVNATADDQVVDLDGTFQRILGTGQDPVNNGGSLSQVRLPAYDAAILVRPDGTRAVPEPAPQGPNPAPAPVSQPQPAAVPIASPQPEPAAPQVPAAQPAPVSQPIVVPDPAPAAVSDDCGEPVMDDDGFYAWQDTCVRGRYHLQSVGTGPFARYDGTVRSSAEIQGVNRDGFERGDEAALTADQRQVDFVLQVGRGKDRVSFDVADSGLVCVALNANGRILIGSAAASMSGFVDLDKEQPCGCADASVGTEPGGETAGLFFWRDSCGGDLKMRLVGLDRNLVERYIGTLTSDAGVGVRARLGFERHDSATTVGEDRVDFDLSVWRGTDGLVLDTATDGAVCLDLQQYSGQVYLANAPLDPGAGPVDLLTGRACR
jgi:hypothetical protein